MWLTVPVTLSGYCSHFPGIREQQGSVRAAGPPQRLEKLERGEALKTFLDWKRTGRGRIPYFLPAPCFHTGGAASVLSTQQYPVWSRSSIHSCREDVKACSEASQYRVVCCSLKPQFPLPGNLLSPCRGC